MNEIYPILSGASGAQRWLEVITNNLANVNTSGFKREYPLFSGIGGEVDPAARVHHVDLPPQTFSQISNILTDFSPGSLQITGQPLDLSVEEEGFFALETPQGTRYTRAGHFTLDQEGQIVTPDGYLLQGVGGTITLPPGEINIQSDGKIIVDGINVDTLQVLDFPDLSRLQKVGENLFDAGGINAIPLENGRIRQGALEGSNVNSISEMVNMVRVMRLYEAAQKVIHTADQMAEKAANDLGRLR